MPRLTNTIRLRIHSKDKQEINAFLDVVKEIVGQETIDADITTIADDTRITHSYEPIHQLLIRLYNQREQKAFLAFLLESLSEKQKTELLMQADTRLDEHLNFFFRLDKEAFKQQQAKYVLRGDVVQVRMNMCAHPKNKQTVLAEITRLLG